MLVIFLHWPLYRFPCRSLPLFSVFLMLAILQVSYQAGVKGSVRKVPSLCYLCTQMAGIHSWLFWGLTEQLDTSHHPQS